MKKKLPAASSRLLDGMINRRSFGRGLLAAGLTTAIDDNGTWRSEP